MPTIEEMIKRLEEIRQEAEIRYEKMMTYYNELGDEVAATAHHLYLLQLNDEYLELDNMINKLTKEVPPPHEHLFI